MLAGVSRVGVGELVPRLGDLPVDPALRGGQGEQAEERDEGEHGQRAAAGEPALARRRRPLGGRELDESPAASSTAAIRISSAPNSWPASTRAAIGARSVVSPSCENAHAITGPATATAPASGDQRPQTQRHEHEPGGDPERERDQRAARVGQHHADQQQADRRARPAR